MKGRIKKYIVYGLSHALLDLLDGKDYNLKESIFIETGGMKGLRDEIEKDKLHKIISDGFNTNNVHSEYNDGAFIPKLFIRKTGIYDTCLEKSFN